MDINQLKYFITLVEAKTFTNAAKVLHIAQPSLSISIKKLENQLGLVLIDRKKRTIHLTREGEILYLEAKRLINQLHHIEKVMDRLRVEGPLELSIGTIESAKYWLPKVIKDIKESYDGVYTLLLELLSLDEVKKALLNYQIHFAITNQYIETNKIQSTLLYEEPLVALLPIDHPLGNYNYLTIKDLGNEPFILCKEGYQTRDDVLSAFRIASIKPNIHFEIERFETACRLVEEELGLTIVPESYVQDNSKHPFHVKLINDQDIRRNVYLVVDKNRYLPPIIKEFIRSIKDYHKG
ncbi:LysR family transcriptional regulator [Virgibacillus ainsalahensis]